MFKDEKAHGESQLPSAFEYARRLENPDRLDKEVFQVSIEARQKQEPLSIKDILEYHDEVVAMLQAKGKPVHNLLSLQFMAKEAVRARNQEFEPAVQLVLKRIDIAAKDPKADIKDIYAALKTIAVWHVCGDTQSINTTREAICRLWPIAGRLNTANPGMKDEWSPFVTAAAERLKATCTFLREPPPDELRPGAWDYMPRKAQHLTVTPT